MKTANHHTFPLYRQTTLLICLVFCIAVFTSTCANTAVKTNTSEINSGYSALRLFLENQQYLATLIRIRVFLTRQPISDESEQLVVSISESSEKAIEEIEKLAAKEPAIEIKEFSEDSIGIETFDSLRMETIKKLIFDSKNFEKNLLLSQVQLLRVIRHLAERLEEKESNENRRAWLNDLAKRSMDHYNHAYERITLI